MKFAQALDTSLGSYEKTGYRRIGASDCTAQVPFSLNQRYSVIFPLKRESGIPVYVSDSLLHPEFAVVGRLIERL